MGSKTPRPDGAVLALRHQKVQRLRRLLSRRSAREAEGAFVVDTSEGPKFVLGGPVGSIEADGMDWDVIDVTTKSTSRIDETAADGSPLFTADVRLPGGWILLTRGGLGDFPWQRAADRPVPVLVNLVTDERIELVNLPHWTGNFLN